ncbi:putative reverse transcriptase domain-containing protein [Tanacetum coccineum]
MTLQGTIKTNNSHSKGTMWNGLILQGLGRRNHTEDPNLYAPNATTIMMGSVLLNAPSAKGLVIRPETVKASLLLPTTREPKGQKNVLTCFECTNNQRAQEAKNVLTCFECGAQGHFKSNCPKLKNEIHRNRAGNSNAVARAYTVGTVGTNPNSNFVRGMFLLNNRYASILFDTGADRSFVSTAFSSLIDIIQTTLDHGYDVELADGRISWVNTLIRGCTLNFLNHPFNIDLMLVEIGSFDVIIGMDWLSCHNRL